MVVSGLGSHRIDYRYSVSGPVKKFWIRPKSVSTTLVTKDLSGILITVAQGKREFKGTVAATLDHYESGTIE
jgi:hypothetical protein